MATGPDESGAQQAHKTRRVRDSVRAKDFRMTPNTGCSDTEIGYSTQQNMISKRRNV